MGTPARGEARWRGGRRLLLLPALVAACALHSAAVGAGAEPVVEPAEDAYGFAWRPALTNVGAGGSVGFRSPGKIVPHGVDWTAGPGTPSCDGVPIDTSSTDWSGTCTFSQAGAYTFVCTIHPEEMKGTVNVSAGAGDPPPPPAPGAGQPPASSPGEPVLQALRLPGDQRGAAVRGSVTISATAGGGKLAIELRARRAALDVGGNGTVRVGRLLRTGLDPGPQAFTVALAPAARRALRHRGKLSTRVTIVITLPSGSTTKATRRVLLRV